MPRRKKRRLRWYERESKPTDPRLWLYGPVPSGFWLAADNRRGIVNLKLTKCEMVQYRVRNRIMTAICCSHVRL